MEFSGPIPFGAQVSLAAQVPTRTPPDVPVVDASKSSDRAGANPHSAKQEDAAAAARAQRGARETAQEEMQREQARRDPDTPTGPPPTFEVTPLEAESDLQAALARMEASHNHNRDAEMVRAPAEETGALETEATAAFKETAQSTLEHQADALI